MKNIHAWACKLLKLNKTPKLHWLLKRLIKFNKKLRCNAKGNSACTWADDLDNESLRDMRKVVTEGWIQIRF